MTASVGRRVLCPICSERPATIQSPEGPRCGICFSQEFPMLAAGNQRLRDNVLVHERINQREQLRAAVGAELREAVIDPTRINRALLERAAVIVEGGDVLAYEEAKRALIVTPDQYESRVEPASLIPNTIRHVEPDGGFIIVHGGME